MSSTKESVDEVQSILGYKFERPQLLLEALKTAGTGFSSPHILAGRDGNKRLAQVGSTLLKIIITDEWYFTGKDRVILNNDIARFGTSGHLSSIGRAAHLDGHIQTNASYGNAPPSETMVTRTVEAILGAIWYDTNKNLNAVREAVNKLEILSNPMEE